MKLQQIKGFTLIEVIVALLILSVAFTAIILSIQNNAKQQWHLQDKTAALWVASNIISEAQVGIIRLDKQVKFQRGKRTMFKSDWNWQAKVIPEGSNVYKLLVSVTKANDRKNVFNMQGFLLP